VFEALLDREPVVVIDGEQEIDRVFGELMRLIEPVVSR
jgi:thymidylate kinase